MTENTKVTRAEPRVLCVDHVQVTVPPSGVAQAKAFYGEVLGLEEIPKPAVLEERGGAWYRCGDQQLHLGILEDTPNFNVSPQKAHTAFLVSNLQALRQRLEHAGAPIDVDLQIPGFQRFYTRDPFGNRLEFLQRLAAGMGTGVDDVDAAGTSVDDTSVGGTGVGGTGVGGTGVDDTGVGGTGVGGTGVGGTGVGGTTTSSTGAADTGVADASARIKERVRQMFSRAADAYVTSSSHASGEDLAQLLELAAPEPSDQALDISTGGGHTALAVAPHVAEVIASDLTPRILEAARKFITAQGVSNVAFVVADAEQLPFLEASFDLVTVRIAPHHYANIKTAIMEMARVLVPGGRLVVIDNIAPEDSLLDQHLNDWERRRDPSHVRAYTATEWRRFLAAAGLRVQRLQVQSKPIDFVSWAERMQMPAAEQQQLAADMLAAPEPVRDHFQVKDENGRLICWSADYIVLLATK